MITDLVVISGFLVTAYYVRQFQKNWIGREYEATTLLKLNTRKTTFVFSLAFLGSIAVFAGTVLTGLELSGLDELAYNAGLLFYLAFFIALNDVAKGGEHFWELG